MATEIRITKSSQLNQINDVIHDYWFSLDEVALDESSATLEVRFSRPRLEADSVASGWSLFRRVDVPYLESFLRIHHVRNWALEDTQRVGSYDFNELRFDQAAQRIQVTTGVPLGLVVDVETLEVSVLVTENVVKTEKRLSFFAQKRAG